MKTVETLHSPHGTELKPQSPKVEPLACPKCPLRFEALCVFLDHQRKAHGERRGLA